MITRQPPDFHSRSNRCRGGSAAGGLQSEDGDDATAEGGGDLVVKRCDGLRRQLWLLLLEDRSQAFIHSAP